MFHEGGSQDGRSQVGGGQMVEAGEIGPKVVVGDPRRCGTTERDLKKGIVRDRPRRRVEE